MGANSPRMFAGASDFGSHVSCCGGPPVRNNSRQRLARPKVTDDSATAERVSRGRADNPPANNNCRRGMADPLIWMPKCTVFHPSLPKSHTGGHSIAKRRSLEGIFDCAHQFAGYHESR